MTLANLILLATYCKLRTTLNIRQLIALYLIHEHKELKMHELAKRLKCSVPGAIRAVDRLEAEGLTKYRKSQDDQRDVYGVLTDRGVELVEKLT